MHAAMKAADDFIFGSFPHHSLCVGFSRLGFIVRMHKVLASALPLCCDSVCVCLLICLQQAEESLISLCKAVVLHQKRSLEEVVIGGLDDLFGGGISLDPFVPALLTCQKLAVLKLGPGTLSHKNTFVVLEKLPTLQELVLKDVSIGEGLRLWHPLDKVCLNTIL